jgi:hypothetical protein
VIVFHAVRRSFRRFWLVLAGLAAGPALAAEWSEVTRLDDGTVVSIDRASVMTSRPQPFRRDFPVVQVTARYGREGGATSAVSRNSVNCRDRTITALEITHYKRNGSVARRWSRVDYDFNYRPITPDSVGEAILRSVCAQVSDRAGG